MPEPTEGVFPAKVALGAQTLWSIPALAVLGLLYLLIITVSLDAEQVPLEMLHLKELAPVPKPVIPLVGEEAVVMVPVPLNSDQVPVPTLAVFPARVAVVAQIFWSIPAFAVVGESEMLRLVLLSVPVTDGVLDITLTL